MVQLVAATVVERCNLKNRDQADAEVLAEAFAAAVVSGDNVLGELMLYPSAEYPEAWDYLSRFRQHDCQDPPGADDLRLLLKRHLLVKETADGKWQLRVPLMQQWLRERT